MRARIYKGDCLEVLKNFDSQSVNLIYLDPPFFTQKTHSMKTKDRAKKFSFDDLWVSHTEYAEFLYLRLEQMHRILSSNGSIYFHCDRNASHIVRALLDEFFGEEMFKAEIIWSYRRWSNSKKGFLPAHQNIYYYTKSNTFTFNTIYENYSESTNVDQILQRRRRDMDGKSVYDRDEEGNIISNGGKKGVPLRDTWEIPYLNPKAKERTGYPTQKPILLLERIIKISTNEGDTVLDPFCGSGTTLVAAVSLNRKAIGIDISDDALKLTNLRLENPVKTESKLLQNGRDSYNQAEENYLSLLKGLEFAPVQRNKGIDAILKSDVDGKPILIRIQREDETILSAANSLYNASKGKNASALFVIAIRKGSFFEFDNLLPSCVEIINSPAIEILKLIENRIR